MYDYNTIFTEFIQFKHFLGYKYKTEEIQINTIKNYLIENNITKITKEVTETYARLNPNLSSNALARNMCVFRELCYFLKYQKNIDCYQIPTKIYPQNHNNFIPYIFSYKEIKLIYSNLNKPLNNYHYSYYSQICSPLIIKILYQTGIRIGELLNIKLENYYHELSAFKIINSKNNEERYVTVSDNLNEEINNFIKKFFYNESNEYIFKLSHSTILNYFKKVLKLSNIKITDKKPRIHDLRHTFVVHNIDKTIKQKKDINQILPLLKAQLGHKSINSIAYYFHINKDILGTVNTISEKELGYLIPSIGDVNE